ncbi:MAG TPA: MraY family glycosyltransferase [Spirochaetia bacterium]|nr:MraY family glycosyltransferase [Spirochaetia bacterium]
MDGIVLYFIAFIAASVVTLLLIPGILALAHRNQWYDKVDERKVHNTDTPRLGGVGMFASFLIVGAIASIAAGTVLGTNTDSESYGGLIAVGLGVVLIHAVGLVDDFTNIRALVKLVGQILAAVVVTLGGLSLHQIGLPGFGIYLNFGIFAYPVTVVWIISLSNALNLVDGLDGYAGGIAGNAALFYGVVATVQGNHIQALLSFILAGAILGFLVFNFPPARIFMGDSGSLFLGFALAVIPLVPGDDGQRTMSLLVPISVLMIPILDTIYAIVRRQRQGRPFYSPDREHLHHKLLDLGMAPRTILAVVYSYCFVMGLGALVVSKLDSPATLFGLLALWIVATALFFVPARIYRHRAPS